MLKRILPIVALLALSTPALAQKIAIANPVKIFNSIRETKDVNDAMTRQRAGIEEQARARKANIEKLQQELQQFKPDSPAYIEAQTKLGNAQIEAQIWLQQQNNALATTFRAHARRMADKINVAIADTAKAKSVDIVIAEHKAEIPETEVDKVQPNQYMQALIMHPVLYNADGTDLTQDVIAKLDQSYQATGTTPAPAK